MSTLQVPAGQTTTITLGRYVTRADGRPLRPAPGQPASAGVGTVTVNPDGTLSWTVPADAGGPTTLVVPVIGDDGAAQQIQVPALVQPAANAPPVVHSAALEVEPGKSVSQDLAALVDTASAEQRQKLTFALQPARADGLTPTLAKGLLTVAAAQTATPGTVASFPFTVADGTNDPVTGELTVTVAKITADPAVVPDVQQTVDVGKPASGNLLAGARSPLPGPLTVVSVDDSAKGADYTLSWKPDGSYQVSGNTVGSYQIPFVVADPSGDASRNVPAVMTLTVRGVPSAPGRPAIADTADSSVALTWAASQENGSPIRTYTVTTIQTGATTECPQTSCTITGLTNGTEYTFSVTATNESGTSKASDPSPKAKPDVAPTAPTGLAAKAQDGGLLVSWAAADPNGGTPVKGYQVTISPAVGGTSVFDVPAGELSKSFTGLANGTAYTVSVLAVNSTGTKSEPSGEVTETPAGLPSPPSGVSITNGRNAGNKDVIDLTWKAADGNGDPALTYLVHWTKDGADLRTDTVAPGSPLAAQVQDVTLGATYAATVVAKNKMGDSPPSQQVSTVPTVAPGPIDGLTAAATGQAGTVKLNWNAPAPTGIALDRYEVRINGGSPQPVGTGTSAQVTAPNGQDDSFTVRWCDAEGKCSQDSAPAGAHPYGPAGQVSGLAINADAAAGQLVASWGAPADNGGLPVTDYQARLSGGTWKSTGGATSATFSGLTNGTSYTIEVRSLNGKPLDAGGAGAIASKSGIPYTQPSTMSAPSATAGQDSVTVRWTAPNNGGRPIDHYAIQMDGSGTIYTSPASTSSTTLTVTSHTNHTFTVRAVTNAPARSTGNWSNRSAAVLPWGPVPAVPGITKTGATQTSISFSWSRPASNGLAPYTFEYKRAAESTWASTTGTTGSRGGLSCGTTYTVQIRARDSQGHTGPISERSWATSACPARPAAQLVHGPYSTQGYCGSGCWLLQVNYQNLPRGSYRICFHFDREGAGCWRSYTATLSGDGSWNTNKDYPADPGRYGYRTSGWVKLTGPVTVQSPTMTWR